MKIKKYRKNLLGYSRDLRGFSNNRYGGHQATRMRTYRQQLAWGTAGECYRYSVAEIQELEEKMRAEGTL